MVTPPGSRVFTATQRRRQQNLQRVLERMGEGHQRRLALQMPRRAGTIGVTEGRMSQLVNGHSPISEEAARAIESILGLAEFALDDEPSEVVGDVAAEIKRVVSAKAPRLAPEKLATVCTLVHERFRAIGRIDADYIDLVINLTK